VPPASLVQWRQGRMKAEGSVGEAQKTEAVGGSATGRDTAENEAGHLVAKKKGGRLIHYRELDEFGFLEKLGDQKLDFD